MPSVYDDSYFSPIAPESAQSLFFKRETAADEMSISSTEYESMRRQPRRRHVAVKAAVAILVTLCFYFLLQGARPSGKISDLDPESIEDKLSKFEGHHECGVTSQSIYTPPSLTNSRIPKHKVFCPNRKSMLEAMSGGGRHGFDAPFVPAKCQFRWYSTPEICMILERFDGIVFVGDDMLRSIYAAFNMLLRQDLAVGGLKQWELSDDERIACRCDAQFINPKCTKSMALDGEEVASNNGHKGSGKSPYYCNRVPHFFLHITGSPAAEDLHTRFTTLLKGSPDSYKPIPVLHSLGLSTSLSWPTATASMDEWVSMADASGRNVPFLWIGPNAAGHLKPPTQILSQGNNALWHYTVEMAKEAQSRDLDALGMYNLTLQASSWDGSGYGMRVALVQAMMVVNWLARVDST